MALRTRSRPAPAAAEEDDDLAAAIAASLADAGASPELTFTLWFEVTVCSIKQRRPSAAKVHLSKKAGRPGASCWCGRHVARVTTCAGGGEAGAAAQPSEDADLELAHAIAASMGDNAAWQARVHVAPARAPRQQPRLGLAC